MRKILMVILLAAFWRADAAIAEVKAVFEPGEHCVAWKTRKTMALIKTVEPVGKNCRISVKMVKVDDGSFRFDGSFPLKDFASGEKERDATVVELLSGGGQSDLQFQSKAKGREEWLKILAAGHGEIDGYLKIAGREYVIRPELIVEPLKNGFAFHGVLVTDYKKFGIDPPKIVGGLVARVHNYLELHFQFQSLHIDGFAQMMEKN